MKYKIGEKVRYDGGDWWFYGTVSAVFEHSICPCYRLNVERMEKKNCKFSITQFEFELEPYNEVGESGKDKRKWDNTEVELLKKYYGVLDNEDLSKMLKRSPQSIEEKRLQLKSEQGQATPLLTDVPENAIVKLQTPLTEEAAPETGKKQRRKRKPKQEPVTELETENVEKTQEPKKKATRRKRGEAWDMNLEMYQKGEKSNTISTWVAQNRREYKTKKLSERKLAKLMAINFPFEPVRKKKKDSWYQRFEEWLKGERKSTPVKQWRQRSIKQYLDGKLDIDKIAKLKEIGILK